MFGTLKAPKGTPVSLDRIVRALRVPVEAVSKESEPGVLKMNWDFPKW
jgi:hypothetical protein